MRETQILRGLHKARATNHLSRGTAFLHGPGTATSDSIPASLSKGEAVLPTKTVHAVGAENIARLIEETNGKPPARGLKAGGGYYTGEVPLTDDIVGPRRPQTVNVDAGDLTSQARAQAAARTPPPMGNTSNATPPPVQEAAPAPKSVWQQAKQWGGNQLNAARGRPTMGMPAVPSAPAQPSMAKPVLGGLAAGAMGGAAGYAAAQAAKSVGDPSNNTVRANPTETEQILKIPGQSSVAPAPQPYNYFADNETGRNIGNTLNAVSMTGGAGPLARSALGMGTGAISKTLKLAERPLVAGAVQGAAQGVRDVNTATVVPTQAAAPTKAVEAAPAQGAPMVAPTPTANGRQYLPGAVTAEDHAESDRLLNSVRGQWGSDSNDKGLRARALDTVNKAWAMRGDGIKATMDPRGNGQLVFSNSTVPEKMPYVDTKGAPTADYKQTRQFAESSAGLRAQQPMNLAWRKQMVDEQNTAYQRDVEARKYRDEQRQTGSKSFDEYLKNDPSMFVDDPEGKKPPSLDERALARKRAYIAQTLPSVRVGDKEMSLDEAFSAYPQEAKAFAQQASNEHTLSEFANKYSKGAALGKGVAPGRVAIVDGPRAAELADLAANMHLPDYLETKLPWINNQRVQIRGVDGPISVPLKDIIKDPNGRAMLEALGRLPVSK